MKKKKDSYKFRPLNDQWDHYFELIQKAHKRGKLNNIDDAEDIVWPRGLYIAESEKEEINRFLFDKTEELVDLLERNLYSEGELNPNLIASFLFRSVLSGMMWQGERLGR